LFLAVLLLPGFVSAMSATINIPAKFSTVKAGESVYFETDVKWPENSGRKDLRIEYSISDKNGVEVAYLKVLKAIETQASFMDSMVIPENAAPGLYKIKLTLSDYQDLNHEVAASFTVAKSGGSIQIYLFIIIGILVVVALAVIIGMVFLIKRKRA
jgi:DNA gyrase/topoisomerase IV subunit A